MRWIITLLLAVSTAAAHGGGGFRGPNGGVPPGVERGILCDCAKIECKKCATADLRTNKGVSCEQETTVVKRWDDFARIRTRIVFATKQRAVEGYVRLSPGPVFAAVSGDLHGSDTTQLVASLGASQDARRRYLFARRSMEVDPLLALRRGPARVDVRVLPITKSGPATATIDGYVMTPATAPDVVRLYRTGARVLAVLDAERAHDAALIDAPTGRALLFMTHEESRSRFPGVEAVNVPFVPALETAVTGEGDAAAGDARVVVALAKGAVLPPFIGPDRGPAGGVVPPGSRDPSDPQPPPPPPPSG